MSRYVIEGEYFDPLKSEHAFYGPFRRKPLTATRWAKLLRWLRKAYRGAFN